MYDKETIEAFAVACTQLMSGGDADENGGKDEGRGIVLISDPKIERSLGSREMLKSAFLKSSAATAGRRRNRPITIEEVDLPLPAATCAGKVILSDHATSDGSPTSIDGRDHEARMKEETILMRCTF